MAFDTNDTRSGAGGISSEKRPSASRETPAGQQPDEDFKSLLDSYEGRTQSFSEGEVIKGRVIAISAGNSWPLERTAVISVRRPISVPMPDGK